MIAKWSNEKKVYEIEFTERDLGVLLFALTVARYETGDKEVIQLLKQLTNLNNATGIDLGG